MNDQIKQKILILYKQHKWSLRKIAEKIHLSHEYVRQILGPKVVRKRERVDINKAHVYADFKKTQSYQETANKFKISRQLVFVIVKRMEGDK